MLFLSLPAALLALTSLTTALPSTTPPRNNTCTEKDILAALAGTYTLLNTTRSALLPNPRLPSDSSQRS
jgi:hypothetical protein